VRSGVWAGLTPPGLTITSTLQIPLGGILTPLTIPPPAPITLEGFPSTLTFAPGSTEIRGLIPAY